MVIKAFDFYEHLVTEPIIEEYALDDYITGGITTEQVENGKKGFGTSYMNRYGEFVGWDGFFSEWSEINSRKLVTDIDEELKVIAPEIMKTLLGRIIFEIENYIQKLNLIVFFKKRPFFVKDLEFVKPDIERLCQYYGSQNGITVITYKSAIEVEKENADVGNSAGKQYPKFQWMGQTNVLVTLFYELIIGQDNREPLLVGNKNNVKQFLLDNFLDSSGNTLSEATITTIFTPSKEDKRANKGDRIELGNVKHK